MNLKICFCLFCLLFLISCKEFSQHSSGEFSASIVSDTGKINRYALVTRHNVIVTSFDTMASLSVGNGGFAFTVDPTGLQTFPFYFQNGIPHGRNRTSFTCWNYVTVIILEKSF